jgi:hypothetical protein
MMMGHAGRPNPVIAAWPRPRHGWRRDPAHERSRPLIVEMTALEADYGPT